MKTKIIAFLYKIFGRPLFFTIDPERIHDLMLHFGNFLGKFGIGRAFTKWLFDYRNPALEQTIKGIHFRNPVGLSAGFDKDAQLTKIIDKVGFGFAQIGSITLNPYNGNPKPRLTRLKKSKGILVYYGLKNIGVDKILERIKKNPPSKDLKISLSIAKTNCKENADAEKGRQDWQECYKKAVESEVADFHTINISCPNTYYSEPTTPEYIEALLKKLREIPSKTPLFFKMPINLPWPDFKKILDLAVAHKVDGVIIGNLNKNHLDPDILDQIPKDLKGGISGIPTQRLSNELISQTYKAYGDQLIIIGVGGIFSAEDAYEKIKRGASLVQVITGMIYQGPQLIGDINKQLVDLLKADGFANIQEAVGSHYKTH